MLRVLACFLIFIPAGAVQADWISEWQQTLNELWAETKAVSSEYLDPERYRPAERVTLGIAYGTEKRAWFEWAVEAFAETQAGSRITIELIPMGSVEGAQAVLARDERIHVWSPASSLVENILVEPWEREHGQSPVLSDAPLVLTPMVIAMWKDRYEAFVAHYGGINLRHIASALNERTGWKAIADRSEWGLFSFGHTTPTQSNSGLMTLVLMVYDYWDLFRGIKSDNLMDEGFITWLADAEGNSETDISSTGTLMREFLRFGPSRLNAIMTYENLALSQLDNAKGRWGEMVVIYPERSVWNDNPFYVLDVPWSSEAHHQAARVFKSFLLSEQAQRIARDDYLFRPANVDLPILEEGSAFNALQDVVQIDVPTIRRPSGAVLEQLMNLWRRL